MKEKKEETSKSHRRGWAGKNPQTYHSLTATMSFLTTMVGSIFVGHYLSQWLEQAWVLWVAVFWGMFGGLFFLLKRLNELEKRYSKRRDNEEAKIDNNS